MMKIDEIRSAFLSYFSDKEHKVVSSSSLIPDNDPTLLFTNAGMVQFKDYFLGLEKRSYQRAVSAQRCLRAGGKHNDLDNVGYTARHHTLFEMLGNFSFGDYFKREAIHYAWDFLTNVLNLPREKLWITVYQEDKEAAAIWINDIGIDPARLSYCGEEDNFWSMGETGPCGPCSEIFYDHGPEVAGGPPGSADAEGDRYIEIWNLVFMQYNRDQSGELSPLPNPAVDTGMGLERIAAVLQGVHSNYEIDLFKSLKQSIIDKITLKDYPMDSVHVIADHIRSCAFLIADGVIPSNEGRGYVLRRIIRRAIRHGAKLGLAHPFFYHLSRDLSVLMGSAYPELIDNQSLIEAILEQEESQFCLTLKHGMKRLEDAIGAITGQVLSGEVAFQLYDTYGFPVDLTQAILRERDLTLDWDGFDSAMQVQRDRSKANSQFQTMYLSDLNQATEFLGYDTLTSESQVLAIFTDRGEQTAISELGMHCKVILDRTPFYPEGGGQAGDIGQITGSDLTLEVIDTQKQGQAIVHHVILTLGTLKKGLSLNAQVKTKNRLATRLNHSATHLMHAALRLRLGKHVTQKGSAVSAERLRFDFSHPKALSQDEIQMIERCVNQKIRDNLTVKTEIMTPEAAQAKGALALFGEKYGETVRVLTMGDFSCELCGGTHVGQTAEIALFKIVSEQAIASGIRRIEAVTGEAALERYLQFDHTLAESSALLKLSDYGRLPAKIEGLMKQQKATETVKQSLEAKIAHYDALLLLEKAERIEGISLLIHMDTNFNPKTMRELFDKLKDKLSPAIIVLVSDLKDKINIVAGLSEPGLESRSMSAKAIVQFLCGRGGGRFDFAQGGGQKPADLSNRLAELRANLIDRLSA